MKERPILFSGPMVRAILEGRKTQTRRIVKPQPPDDWSPIAVERYHPAVEDKDGMLDAGPEIFGAYSEDRGYKCPYGGPGDRLWVRESFSIESFGAGVAQIRYKADNARGNKAGVSDRKLPNRCGSVPSIHMPRHCSRITLELTDVRVELLQKISESDACSEGVMLSTPDEQTFYGQFRVLWESINGKGSWSMNPFVWVLEFRRLEA